jgi:DNA repair protein RecO
MSLLPRPSGSGRGFVLRAWPTGETSVVAAVLVDGVGLLRLLAKGAREQHSRLRPLVQPGRLADLEFSLDPARELQYLRGGTVVLDPLAVSPTLERSVYLLAALEIIDCCRPGHGHETGLFTLCEAYVEVLSCADPGREAALYYAFEIALLELLGVRPELEICTHCGARREQAADGVAWLSPAAGGLVCGDCADAGAEVGGAAVTRRLTPADLAAWPELAAAPRVWPVQPLAREAARNWGVMLHRFLEYHLPGYRLPASLALLRGQPR